jgi:hypothetical protein
MKIVDAKCRQCGKVSEHLINSDAEFGDFVDCPYCGSFAAIVPSATFGVVPHTETPCTGGRPKTRGDKT